MLQRRIWWVFLLVLAVGIAVSASIVSLGDKVQAINHIFISEKLPLSQRLGELRSVVADEERILYEYYSFTATKESFQAQRLVNSQHLGKIIDQLDKDDKSHAQMMDLRERLDELDQLSDKLYATLASTDIDWDQARVFLALTKPKVRQIEETMATITLANQTAVNKLGEDSQSSVSKMVSRVLSFSVLIFGVSFFVGYYVVAIIREGLERRRLAMFPERDPNPVFRLSRTGEVLYANPATSELLVQLDQDFAQSNKLLPDDLALRLNETIASPTSNTQFEHVRDKYTFECTVAYLSDFSEFHVYVKDVTARKQAEGKLVYQAFFDPVTGLPNQYQLQKDLNMASDQQSFGTVMMIVADREQEIFETFGADVTENWLSTIAQGLSVQVNTDNEKLYRFGSNAFILVMWSKNFDYAAQRAEQFFMMSRKQVQVDSYELFSTLSIGAAEIIHNQAGSIAESPIKQAASACNRVRRAGGNGFARYDAAMGRAAANRLGLSADLQNAVENGELRLHYQPKVDTLTGRLSGMEALVRWIHPKHGMISPVEFIPIAEETGLIVGIGRWVLREACRQNAEWQRMGLRPLRVAVNLSARQFRSGSLLNEIDTALSESGLRVDALELEITESMVMDDPEAVIELLSAISARGIHLALDDFGTGHSSLAYLKRFPIDCIKIDRAFIKDTPGNIDDVAIARTIVAMAQALNLSTVAEGVETAEQLELLKTLGCNQIQGFFFSRPLGAEDFLAFYRAHL